MNFELTDCSFEVCAELDRAITAALHEAGGEFRDEVQRRTRVNKRGNGGDTKESFRYEVVDNACYVGSNAENAIWEEFGTGVHAEKGGRQDKWVYYDPITDRYYTTDGKKGTRALTKSMQAKAGFAERVTREKLGGLNHD